MGQDTTIIARDFADTLKRQGVLLPPASLSLPGLRGNDKTLHRIGTKYLYSCFLLKRRGLYTVYVSPTYGRYRGAFKQALDVAVDDADIDHYYARAAAALDLELEAGWRDAGETDAAPDSSLFIAIGALPPALNRSVQARTDLDTLLRKALGLDYIGETEKNLIGMRRYGDPAIAANLLKTGFMVPVGRVKMNNVVPVTRDTLKGGRETEMFGGLFGL
jgi:hypothetical protein